jgi:hypothetical protein
MFGGGACGIGWATDPVPVPDPDADADPDGNISDMLDVRMGRKMSSHRRGEMLETTRKCSKKCKGKWETTYQGMSVQIWFW